MNNKPELSTERIILRPVTKDHAEALFSYRSDKIVNQYQGWIPNTIEDVYGFIGKVATEINVPDSWFQFVIILKGTNEIIGDLGIHFLDADNKQAEIGCTLAKVQHGKGYATEALRKVIDFLFMELDKHRIIASVDPANTSSIALIERLGFRKEAHFKESLFIEGQWVDDVVYALLKREWN